MGLGSANASLLVLAALARAAHAVPPQGELHVGHPCPRAGAHFGHDLEALDFDGDGALDLAVGAEGEGTAYVFLGPFDPDAGFASFQAFGPAGPAACPVPATDGSFGWCLAAGGFDADPADELVVGAPYEDVGGAQDAGAVYVFGLAGFDPLPLVLEGYAPEVAHFGDGLVAGDFDDDGALDLAVGAPLVDVAGVLSSGEVAIWFGPLSDRPPDLLVPNPAPAIQGTFGQRLAVADPNGDGVDDLVASAIFNTAGGIPKAGQVYVFPGPIAPASFFVLEDPVPDASDLPYPRFGMHLSARDDVLLVGAPRKNWGGEVDTGLGYRFTGPAFGSFTLHPLVTPEFDGLLGYRTLLANLVGDATPDAAFVALQHGSVLVWDGAAPGVPPVERPSPAGAGDHWAQGFEAADFVPGGYDELVLGSMNHDEPGLTDVGRVTVEIEGAYGYCVGAPNSAGPGATVGFQHTTSVAANDLRLVASGCPPNQLSLFLYSATRAQNPVGNGFFCLGGPFFRIYPASPTGPAGAPTKPLDLTSPPAPAAQILAGTTWNFANWYRDPAAGGALFNFSAALELTFRE